jgi:hypothetical protein
LTAFFSLKALYPSASPSITAMNGLGPMPVWGNRIRLRVLRFCAKYPRWHTLMELDQVSLLEDDDVLTVPPLIERQLLRHDPAIKAVRITPAGEVTAYD